MHRGAGSTIGCLCGATSTSAGRGGKSDCISCLRCHRVSHGLYASTPHQARDTAVSEFWNAESSGTASTGTLPVGLDAKASTELVRVNAISVYSLDGSFKFFVFWREFVKKIRRRCHLVVARWDGPPTTGVPAPVGEKGVLHVR